MLIKSKNINSPSGGKKIFQKNNGMMNNFRFAYKERMNNQKTIHDCGLGIRKKMLEKAHIVNTGCT